MTVLVGLIYTKHKMSSNREEDIKYIREWMKKEAHLPEPFDDPVILKFLHCTYYSLEQTKKCIDRFCTSRHSMPQIYTQRDPLSTSMQTAASLDLAAEYKCGDFEMFFFKLGDDVNKFIFYDTVKSISVKLDYWVKTEPHLAEGHGLVMDLTNINIKHLSKLSPVLLKDYIIYLLEAMPVRVKKVIIINAPPVTEMFYNLVKPVLPPEIVDIIVISPDDKCLEKVLDKKTLPSDYGGEAKSVRERSKEYDEVIVRQYRKMFLNDDLWKGDAARIPKNPGKEVMSGSFRALAID